MNGKFAGTLIGVAALCLIGTNLAAAQSAWTHPANPSGGLNIGGPSPFGRDEYSIDIFKNADLWWQVDVGNGFYSRQDDKPLDLDTLGWVRSLPKVNGVEREVIAPFSDIANTRSGRYVLTWKGEGRLDYDGTVLERGDHRWVIDVIGNKFHWIEIGATDPNRTGNYIRDIKLYRIEDTPLIKGGEIFAPEFIDKVSKFRVLRFMAGQNINFSKVSDWNAARETIRLASWSNGIPTEVITRLANTAKADVWLSVPHLASDDYVRNLARYLRTKVDPNLRIYLEYTNEFFTDIFDQAPYLKGKGIATFGPDARNSNAQYYAYRAGQVFDVFKAAFGPGFDGRVFPVLTINRFASPETLSDLLTGPDIVRIGGKRPVDGLVKVLATDAYLGFDIPQETECPADQQGCLLIDTLVAAPDGTSRLINVLRTGKGFRYPVGIPNFRTGVRALKAVANQYGLQLYAYEGGSALANFRPGYPAALTDFFSRTNRDPAIKSLYRDIYSVWNAEAGGINAHFASFSADSPAGNFATWDTVWSPQPAQRGVIPVSDNERVFNDPRDPRPGAVFSNGRLLLGTAAADTLSGTAQADRIYGSGGNDVLRANGGADFMAGGDGGDTYILSLATSDGATIQDFGRSNDQPDRIELTDNGLSGRLVIKRIGADFQVGDGVRSLTLKGQFAGTKTVPQNFIERLVLSDGTIIDLIDYAQAAP